MNCRGGSASVGSSSQLLASWAMRGWKRRETGLDLERAAARFARWRQAVSVAQPPAQPAFVELALGRRAAEPMLGRDSERRGVNAAGLFASGSGPRSDRAGAELWGRSLMLQITPQMRILVAVEPVDFRKGIDGLAQFRRQALGEDPLGGALFVFRNRRSDGGQGAGLRRPRFLALSEEARIRRHPNLRLYRSRAVRP